MQNNIIKSYGPSAQYQGPVSNAINDLTVTSTGKAWMSGNGGVSSYSSGYWTNFTKASSGGGLTSDFCSGIAVDSVGNVWVGTAGFGIDVYDGSSWSHYDVQSTGGGLASDVINDILVLGEEEKFRTR